MSAADSLPRIEGKTIRQLYRLIEICAGPAPADRTLVGIHIEQSDWLSPPLASGKMTIRAYALGGRLVGNDRAPYLLGSMGGNYDTGRFQLTGGTMVLAARARGCGLGTYLMNEVVRWAKSQGFNGTVRPVMLSERDAETQAECDRRNRFYEQFGYRLNRLRTVNGVERAAGYSDDDQMLDEFDAVEHVKGVAVYEADEGLAMVVKRLEHAEQERARETSALHYVTRSKETLAAVQSAKLTIACWWAGIATLASIAFACALVRML